MSTEFAEILGALGRIEQKIDGHMEEDSRRFHAHGRSIDELFSKANEADKFQARAKGIAKGVSVVVCLIIGVAGVLATV